VNALGFAQGIAVELGAGWRAGSGWTGESAFVRHEDGRGLFILALSFPFSARGRAEVRGVYPQGWGGDRDRDPVITVSMSRKADAVARDIRRRMLPAYAERLAKARARVARDDADRGERERVAALIMAAVPGTVVDQVQGWASAISLRLASGGYRNQCVIRSGSDGATVDLDVRALPAADALRMLAALGELHGQAAAMPGAGESARAGARGAVSARERRGGMLRLIGFRRAA
jgi:hypothetical protein